MVKVTNLETGRSLLVKVNDRGPYVKGRVLDLSEGAAHELGVGNKGLMRVALEQR
jgi:rare lipoprotein A